MVMLVGLWSKSLYRYLRALAAIYIRMTFRAAEVYEVLEPLLKDYRKLRYRDQSKHTQLVASKA
jgi:hypothetical protein